MVGSEANDAKKNFFRISVCFIQEMTVSAPKFDTVLFEIGNCFQCHKLWTNSKLNFVGDSKF